MPFKVDAFLNSPNKGSKFIRVSLSANILLLGTHIHSSYLEIQAGSALCWLAEAELEHLGFYFDFKNTGMQ